MMKSGSCGINMLTPMICLSSRLKEAAAVPRTRTVAPIREFNAVSILSARHQPLDRDLLGFGQRSGPQLVPFRRIDVGRECTGVADSGNLNKVADRRTRVRVVHKH